MIRYICRHCGRRVGQLDEDLARTELGLSLLTPEEQQDLLETADQEDTLYVKILCEHCLPIPWPDGLWYN